MSVQQDNRTDAEKAQDATEAMLSALQQARRAERERDEARESLLRCSTWVAEYKAQRDMMADVLRQWRGVMRLTWPGPNAQGAVQDAMRHTDNVLAAVEEET